ncbi:hypothetical protein HBA_0527 [Sodalis endosymbiont of Henestaris halophilus]|nr:hypothetical protein HBA_0527 [Sodalis endosymbiont of Henestaris halophilus]
MIYNDTDLLQQKRVIKLKITSLIKATNLQGAALI